MSLPFFCLVASAPTYSPSSPTILATSKEAPSLSCTQRQAHRPFPVKNFTLNFCAETKGNEDNKWDMELAKVLSVGIPHLRAQSPFSEVSAEMSSACFPGDGARETALC